jgi:hypothetical protein
VEGKLDVLVAVELPVPLAAAKKFKGDGLGALGSGTIAGDCDQLEFAGLDLVGCFVLLGGCSLCRGRKSSHWLVDDLEVVTADL